MKTKIFLLAVSLLIYGIGFSQSGTPHKKIYYARINNGDDYGPKRILYDVTDSTVFLQDIHSHSIEEVSCREIEKIKVRSKGTTGIAVTSGAVGGIVLGLIIGGMTKGPEDDWLGIYDDYKGPVGAGIGLLAGGTIGAVIGTVANKVMVINREASVFKSYSAKDLKGCCQK